MLEKLKQREMQQQQEVPKIAEEEKPHGKGGDNDQVRTQREVAFNYAKFARENV